MLETGVERHSIPAKGNPPSRLGTLGRAWELARPCILFGIFVVAGPRVPWWAALGLALLSVFAWSILVHDLIHNALRFRKPVADVALMISALFLIKSGHALQALHLRHHRKCLDEGDVEGRVAFASFLRLLILGPWLAMAARLEAFRATSRAMRGYLVVETVLDGAVLAALILIGRLAHTWLPLVYWGAVVMVTVSAPIWGAKIPHMVPYRSRWVHALIRFTGRLTPAIASVLLHELHHRRPTLPVSLLPANRQMLDQTKSSDCASRMGHEP